MHLCYSCAISIAVFLCMHHLCCFCEIFVLCAHRVVQMRCKILLCCANIIRITFLPLLVTFVPLIALLLCIHRLCCVQQVLRAHAVQVHCSVLYLVLCTFCSVLTVMCTYKQSTAHQILYLASRHVLFQLCCTKNTKKCYILQASM